jgi:hypothetical protein
MLEIPNFIKVDDARLTHEQLKQLAFSLVTGDQVFQNEAHGFFNAGLMFRLMESHPEWFERVTIPIDSDTIEYVTTNVEINGELIKTMDSEQLNAHVFIVTLDDETPHLLIDGHHRIIARNLRGLTSIKAIISNREATEIINVLKWDNLPKIGT